MACLTASSNLAGCAVSTHTIARGGGLGTEPASASKSGLPGGGAGILVDMPEELSDAAGSGGGGWASPLLLLLSSPSRVRGAGGGRGRRARKVVKAACTPMAEWGHSVNPCSVFECV